MNPLINVWSYQTLPPHKSALRLLTRGPESHSLLQYLRSTCEGAPARGSAWCCWCCPFPAGQLQQCWHHKNPQWTGKSQSIQLFMRWGSPYLLTSWSKSRPWLRCANWLFLTRQLLFSSTWPFMREWSPALLSLFRRFIWPADIVSTIKHNQNLFL